MKALRIPSAIVLAALIAVSVGFSLIPTQQAYATTRYKKVCCMHCGKGIACGNSCISRAKTCHKAIGCACNG